MFDFFINNVGIWLTQTEHLNLLMIKMRASTSIAFVLISTFLINAQQIFEYAPKDNIKSIKFFGSDSTENFPLVALGQNITLIFDDLNGDEADYYFKIKHFNHDWTPSELFKNEYLAGYDNLRINDYNTSFNTIQTFTHYRLTIPNENIQFMISGNYLIEIYDSYEELVFSRRFCIYEEEASVRAAVYRPQNMDRFNTHQSLHFGITPFQGVFRNPEQTVFVHILQNRQWDSNLSVSKPQYFTGTTLEYRYETPTQFEGGNEYYFFDTKDLRITGPNISYTNLAQLYETYLNVNIPRKYQNYTYAPDINGGYEIRNIMRPGDPNTEADYSYVYFSLAADYELNDNEIYIYGSFNNYHLSNNNRMYYNPSLEIYEGVLLLKQGFYNYKYVVKKDNQLDKNFLSGSNALTENDYLILVYYRNIGSQYDALVAFGQVNSFQLDN